MRCGPTGAASQTWRRAAVTRRLYGSVANVPGREFNAFARVPGAAQPSAMLVQVPDGFDAGKRCLVVAASSGSRGIYGTISIAGGWALHRVVAQWPIPTRVRAPIASTWPRGRSIAADGTVAATDATLAFKPAPSSASSGGVAYKHAHSQDNPEADWGLREAGGRIRAAGPE